MRKKPARSKAHSNTLGFALFIGALIFLLVIVGIAIKIFLLFEHSSFDGKHQFSVEIQEPQATRFVVFTPSDNSVHTLFLNQAIAKNVVLTFGIPVDATLVSQNDISIDELAKDLLLQRKQLHTSTTIIDGVNLFIFIHTANKDKMIAQNVSSTTNVVGQDSAFSKVFTDPTIYKEGESVAVVNASGISGVGSEVGRLLSHLGANVVSITTAQDTLSTSTLQYSGNTSYTLSRISQVLRLAPTHLSMPSVSDITITVGTDFPGKF